MRMNLKFISGAVIAGWLSVTSLYAAEVANTTVNTTATQNSSVNNTMIGAAQDWGLSDSEWGRYQQLMQGPDRLWYPSLTPAEILGVEASNSQEQRHFAEIVAKEQHDKLARELQFDSAVHQALTRLYSDEPVIRPFDLSIYNPIQKSTKAITLQSGDHLVLFVDLKNSSAVTPLPSLISLLGQHAGVILDIYCVNAEDDAVIRDWAKTNALPVAQVTQGAITLNRDNGQWQKTAGNKKLPLLLLVHAGKSSPVNVSDLT